MKCWHKTIIMEKGTNKIHFDYFECRPHKTKNYTACLNDDGLELYTEQLSLLTYFSFYKNPSQMDRWHI